MKRIHRISASVLFSALLLASVTACGGGTTAPSGGENTDASTGSEAVTTEAPKHIYPELDCNGDTFTILNPSTTWGFYTDLDHESQTGDVLDDTVYSRNRDLEEKFNFKLEVVEEPIAQLAAKARTVITADEDTYDVVLCGSTYIGPLITEGLFINLLDVPELQLDEEYWVEAVTQTATIRGKALYYAMSDLSLFDFESSWCMFFNETMLNDLGLEKPYDLARSGKWTFDELAKYMKVGSNLNGDEAFTPFDVKGSCIYGLTSSYAFPHACIISSGESYIKTDEKGDPYFALGSEHFYTLVDKLASMFAKTDEYCSQNNSASESHYEKIFKAGRALFLGAELKASQLYRDLESNFGIVPLPKLEESQESYHTAISKAAPVIAIPMTNKDTKTTGILLDALAYESYDKVLPVFYEVNVSQKGLRNEDSIEMLGIIHESRFFDIGDAYGWTTEVQDKLRKTIDVGSSEVASIIAAYQDIIAGSIEKTMSLFETAE